MGEVRVQQVFFLFVLFVQTNPFPLCCSSGPGLGFVLDNLLSNCSPALGQLLNWA